MKIDREVWWIFNYLVVDIFREPYIWGGTQMDLNVPDE